MRDQIPAITFPETTDNQLTVDQIFRRAAEFDLFSNINSGYEYTGFDKLYCFYRLNRKHISNHGKVYDVTEQDIASHHLLKYMESIKYEKPTPVLMTSGSFLSMNKPVQEQVIKYLIELSERNSVLLYVGDKSDIDNVFSNTKVKVKVFDSEKQYIIHFIKTNISFNFVLPHTEEKKIRVDLNSDSFNPINKFFILKYFDSLIAKLDREIEHKKQGG